MSAGPSTATRRCCSWRTDQATIASVPSAIVTSMIVVASGSSTSLIPDSMRTNANTVRRARSGTLIDRFAPRKTPGIDPTRSHAIACRSTLPWRRYPAPAIQSRAAACVTSVPTICVADSGNRKSMNRPKKVPEPTEVRPTTKPQLAPIKTATILSRRLRRNGPSPMSARGFTNVRARNPMPPRISAPPMILLIVASAPSENELASSTPTSEHGPEPTRIQTASGRLTLPSRR